MVTKVNSIPIHDATVNFTLKINAFTEDVTKPAETRNQNVIYERNDSQTLEDTSCKMKIFALVIFSVFSMGVGIGVAIAKTISCD